MEQECLTLPENIRELLCCSMGYSEIASWCGFPPYWRPCGDLVDRRFLEREFGINQIYFFFSMNLRNLYNTQEAGQWWAFCIWNSDYVFPPKPNLRIHFEGFFNPPLTFCGFLPYVKKNRFFDICFFFLFIGDFFGLVWFGFCFILFRFCCVSFRLISRSHVAPVVLLGSMVRVQ